MRYWWVNHKQTWRQEIGGEYLWSPKKEKGGKRSRSYDNVRTATRGDLVLSYANGHVSYVGIVSDNSISAPKPDEFGNRGDYWGLEGWRLPVFWIALPEPVSPKNIFDEIKSLFPETYSPLNDTGRGNQKVYLAEISQILFDAIIKRSNLNRELLQVSTVPTLDRIRESLDEQVADAIRADLQLSDTEKEQLFLSRRGQGIFKRNVTRIERACRITGIETPDLLIASHIKPWRTCQSAQERLDGNNGLLLTPSIDRLFDRGLISFEDDGTVNISPRLSQEDARRLGLKGNYEPKAFNERQCVYLEHHRKSVYLP